MDYYVVYAKIRGKGSRRKYWGVLKAKSKVDAIVRAQKTEMRLFGGKVHSFDWNAAKGSHK
jgi:hypothetical protein